MSKKKAVRKEVTRPTGDNEAVKRLRELQEVEVQLDQHMVTQL